jgi:hypothetical protein
MKLKVVALSEVGSSEKKGGKEEELAQVLSQQSGVGKEGGDEEGDQMGDVRVEPVPRYRTCLCELGLAFLSSCE